MKLLVELTEEQENFLKQFAQNQCEGSNDNKGTAKPIHIVQTMDKEYYPYSEEFAEFVDGEVVFTTDSEDSTWFYSIEECIQEYFNMTDKIPSHSIQPFNENTIEMTYQNKDGYKEYADTYEKYFKYYGIDEFEIAVEVKEYRTVSYHFTLAEAKRYIGYQRHNLVEPRIYTVSGGYANKGDYIHFWDLLMGMGTQLVKEEEEQLAYTE